MLEEQVLVPFEVLLELALVQVDESDDLAPSFTQSDLVLLSSELGEVRRQDNRARLSDCL